MMRQVLIAWMPWLAWLAGACVVLLAVVRLHRRRLGLGRVRWRRLAQLHRNQAGSAQSVMFVWTLPIFMLVVTFIVQISQIMIGLVVVQYSAYAAARSASVWIPAWVEGGAEVENCVSVYSPDPTAPDQFFPILDVSDPSYGPTAGGVTYIVAPGSDKFEKIRSAAVMACAPISPSRRTSARLTGQGAALAVLLGETFGRMAPGAQSTLAVPSRMRNKVAWAMANTFVEIRFFHSNMEPPLVAYPPLYDDYREFQELGWQDPVTVTVHYNMALLPGPGRVLARPNYVPGYGSGPGIDAAAASIVQRGSEKVLPLTASATMGIEGEKSKVRYAYNLQ